MDETRLLQTLDLVERAYDLWARSLKEAGANTFGHFEIRAHILQLWRNDPPAERLRQATTCLEDTLLILPSEDKKEWIALKHRLEHAGLATNPTQTQE